MKEKEAFNVMDHKKKKYIAVDRISELPDPPLREILSFLPINQVVQSTILSKRWKHMSTSIPVLFYSGFYPSGCKVLTIQKKGFSLLLIYMLYIR